MESIQNVLTTIAASNLETGGWFILFLSIQILGLAIALYSFLVACDLIYNPKNSAIGGISALFSITLSVCFIMVQTAIISESIMSTLAQAPIVVILGVTIVFTSFVFIIMVSKLIEIFKINL